MSSTQRLQDYIDSLKAARLSGSSNNHQNQQGQQHDTSAITATSSSSPFHSEPRDILELEFMDSLDQRMQHLERNLSSSSSGQTQRRNNNNNNTFNSIVSPAPQSSDLSHHHHQYGGGQQQHQQTSNQRLTLTQKLQQQQESVNRSGQQQFMFANNNTIGGSSRLSSSRYNSNNTFHSQFVAPTSLIFRITLPFLRATTMSANQHHNADAECATFMVHVADLTQTGDDLLWHIIAQARIRFPDLMQVGGFEWTPGAASSLVLFALSQEEATNWVDTDQSKGGAARAGGAFLHYSSATPIHRYLPIARAIRSREEARAKAGSSTMSSSISAAMERSLKETGPQADVEIFVLMKSLVPNHELSSENMRRGVVQ